MQKTGEWEYCGDMNIEHGGLFYTMDDFVHAVSVSPHPENPGRDHDDESWIIWQGDIHILDDDRIQEALDTCGYAREGDGIRTPTGEVAYGAEARKLTIEACHAYGGVQDDAPQEWSRRELAERGVSLEGLVLELIGHAPDEAPAPC